MLWFGALETTEVRRWYKDKFEEIGRTLVKPVF
jgi:hypothetical protein